jgi:hypothetical protein
VSNTPVSFVIELVHRGPLATSPEFETRAAATTGRPAASLPLPPLLDAPSACALRVDALSKPNRALKP